MLIIVEVFGYVKSRFMANCKRHQDENVRKSKDVYETDERQ